MIQVTAITSASVAIAPAQKPRKKQFQVIFFPSVFSRNLDTCHGSPVSAYLGALAYTTSDRPAPAFVHTRRRRLSVRGAPAGRAFRGARTGVPLFLSRALPCPRPRVRLRYSLKPGNFCLFPRPALPRRPARGCGKAGFAPLGRAWLLKKVLSVVPSYVKIKVVSFSLCYHDVTYIY